MIKQHRRNIDNHFFFYLSSVWVFQIRWYKPTLGFVAKNTFWKKVFLIFLVFVLTSNVFYLPFKADLFQSQRRNLERYIYIYYSFDHIIILSSKERNYHQLKFCMPSGLFLLQDFSISHYRIEGWEYLNIISICL